MAIVATEIESIHGDAPKLTVFYRCQDSQGAWHTYGPVITNDPAFSAEGLKPAIAAKMTEFLAEQEALALLGAL